MDRQYIRDAQVIERYLHGRLTAAEEAAFEEAYMADPALLEELELAEKLRDGLRDMPDAELPVPQPARGGWLRLAASPRYGLAASLVAALAVLASGSLYLENQALRNGAGAPLAAASNTRVLPLVAVRGGASANTIAAPGAGDWTVLMLDPGFTDYDRYRAVLVRRDGGSTQELLQADELQPSYEGLLAFGVPARVLTTGDYEIVLEGGRSDWPAGRKLDELTRTPLTVSPAP